MLEKLKDLLYEVSDLLLALAILLIMSSMITWQVSDSMAISEDSNSFDADNTHTYNNEDKIIDSNPIDNSKEEFVIIEDDDEALTQHDNENMVQDNDTLELPEESEVNNEVINQHSTIITIDIPPGTPGVGIANILVDNNLIEESSIFISRIEELNLAIKLKSGTYKIDSNSTIDDIIYILTGKKR